MLQSQYQKTVVLKGPVTVATNASNSSANLDKKDFEWATIYITMPPATATDSAAKFGYCRLQEGDSTSSMSDVTGFVGTTNSTAAAGEFVLGSHGDTTYGATVVFDVDLRKRKRYLKVNTQGAASHQTVCVTAQLSRARQCPNSTTEQGVINFVTG